MEKELWLQFKEFLHEISEGKKTVDDVLTIVLQTLDQLEKQDALPDDSRSNWNASTISQDGEIRI